MAQLHQLVKLQDQLNSDEEFRKAFLADPAVALKREGIVLSQDAQQNLVSTVNSLTKQTLAAPGSNIGARAAETEVTVSVTVKF